MSRMKRANSHQRLDQSSEEEDRVSQSQPGYTRELRARPKKKVVYDLLDDQENLDLEEEEPEQINYGDAHSFIQPKIEMLVSNKSRERKESNGQETEIWEEELFLVKFKNKSYYRCIWMTEEELEKNGYACSNVVRKGLYARIAKVKRMRLRENEHFNPNYLVPDRILNSTDYFSAIQPKKANQIKGTWQQSLQMVCSKLLNFQKNMFPFGTLLIQELKSVASQPQKNGQNQIFSMPIILNRVYFGLYPNYANIWVDIGKAIIKFLDDYGSQNQDYRVVGSTLRQAAIFLYLQWHRLSTQRYQVVKQEFTRSIDLSETHDIDNQNLKGRSKENILLGANRAQRPKSKNQLEVLNPGTLSLDWIAEKKISYNFQYLNKSDKEQLDLNKEVDRFYLVKWKQMSYVQCTWERQSFFKHPQKIEQFNTINKMPNKQLREGLEFNLKLHQELLKYYTTNGTLILKENIRKPYNIEAAQQKLYLFKKRQQKPPKQYKGKDVITFKNYKLLKQFQNESLNWLIKNWYQSRNTILADEMGLGKTIQSIAFLYHLYMHEKVLGPFLVLAPLTTLNQWRREIESWTNFNCLMYYDQGKNEGKAICQTYQLFYSYTRRSGEIVVSTIPKFHILLTNYQNFIKDYAVMKQFAFQHIVIDEAHKMKNSKAILSVNLRLLPCRRVTLMTGTPVQNNTKELWSLLNYIQPLQFPNQEEFLKIYGNLKTEAEVARIKKMLKPYLLRRVKQDVQKLIPKLSQVIIDVQMTKMQKAIYKGLLQKNKNEIIKGLSTANFNNLAIQFRKCCNHPYLISQQLQLQLLKEAHTQQEKNQTFLNVSGKMILLCKLLNKFREQKKKTLVFSQFVIMLELLQEYLQRLGFHCQMLHGGISASNRHRAISRFCENVQVDVFLISTKAGGVGINLTAATEIIIYDSDWNPQNDIQATARAHRIGQKNQVTVYRLITSNSYQSEMFKIASRKLGMDKAIFNGDFFKNNKEGNKGQFQQVMSKEEIQMLLKKGVIGFIENNINEQQFFKQDIDQILQKNARKVEYSLGGDKNYTYSKSKFVGDKSATHLDINSSNFWEVALKDIESPIQKLAKKAEKLVNYTTLQMQQKLMLQLLTIVSQFVKMRVSGSAFNAQDQRILFYILGSISKQRAFNRQYRSIADKLVEEIEKPSRRFKVSAQQIKNVRIGIENPHLLQQQNQEVQEKKYSDDQLFDEGSDQNQQNGKNKKSKKRQKQSEQTPAQFYASLQSSNIRMEYQKVCFICLKPKCSIFCKGICQRSFHKLCWNNYLEGTDEMVELVNLKEMSMKFTEWVQQIQRSLECPECKQGKNVCYCSICGSKGILDQQAKAVNAITRCKNKNCPRFYHLACLSESQAFGWLVQLANKRTQTQQGIFLDKFVCPVHMCFGCGEKVAKATWNSLHSCIKCCKTYHPKCLSKATHYLHLNQSFHICEQHLEKSNRAMLQRQYKIIGSDKKIIMELKKAEKQMRGKRKEIKQKPNQQDNQENAFGYVDFQLSPIDKFNYKDYDEYWCRYCGSRFAEAFCQSPWGKDKLCLHHNKLWKKGKLDLASYKNEPVQPILRKPTELKYLNKLVKQKKIIPGELIDFLIKSRYDEV